MKVKIIFAILLISTSCIIGSPTYQKFKAQATDVNSLTSEIDNSKQAYNDLQNQATTLLSELQDSGKMVCLDNTAMANYIASLCDIQSITACGYTDEVLGDIQTVNSVDDVAYFGSDTVQIRYTVKYSDEATLLQGLADISPAIADLHLDCGDKQATISVTSVTGVYTDISNTGVDIGNSVENSSTQESTEDLNGVFEDTEDVIIP